MSPFGSKLSATVVTSTFQAETRAFVNLIPFLEYADDTLLDGVEFASLIGKLTYAHVMDSTTKAATCDGKVSAALSAAVQEFRGPLEEAPSILCFLGYLINVGESGDCTLLLEDLNAMADAFGSGGLSCLIDAAYLNSIFGTCGFAANIQLACTEVSGIGIVLSANKDTDSDCEAAGKINNVIAEITGPVDATVTKIRCAFGSMLQDPDSCSS